MADTEEQEWEMRRIAPALSLAVLLAPGAQAGSLGRLFFTPEQRTRLEYNRAHDVTAAGGSTSVLAVGGIVQKQGGARTVWINGVAQSAGNGAELATDVQAVVVPGKLQPIEIKVGQKLLFEESAPAEGQKQSR